MPEIGPPQIAEPLIGQPQIAEQSFRAIGTTHRILCTEAAALPEAVAIAQAHLAELDAAASRFRADSELSRLAEAARARGATAVVSPLLADYLDAAWHAARITGGLVDPTVGSALVATGYDADLDVVQARDAAPHPPAPRPGKGWQAVEFVRTARRITTPRGVLIDLGATAKAHAADRISRLLSDRLPGGFLVNLGGDIAVSGALPADGWQIGVQAADGSVLQVVRSTGQAVCTSSTVLRTWRVASGRQAAPVLRHHIIDPRTGDTADTPWAQVTCVAASALEANAASTAAVVLAERAPEWLARNGLPARLDALDGTVRTTPGWPDPA